MKACVLKGANNFFDCITDDGIIRTCSLKGKKLKTERQFYNPLAPGDEVEIEIDPHDPSKAQILSLGVRKNYFPRFNQKTRHAQILASNIDAVLIFTTPQDPPFRPRFIDRLLVASQIQGISAIIVVNKCDLPMDPQTRMRIEQWQSLHIEVFFTAALYKTGLDPLCTRLHHKRVVAVGQSGVGKSSMLNAVSPHAHQKTAEISYKYNRGIHTTTQGVLLPIEYTTKTGELCQFSIIDTPGVRNFIPYNVRANEVIEYFPEMHALAQDCGFGSSCSHQGEKDCAVLAALDNNTLHTDRYISYLNLKDELTRLFKEDYS